MPESNRRTQLLQAILLASSDVARLSDLIVQVKSAGSVDEARLQRLADQWIETNLRANSLREELRKLEERQGD